MPRWWFYWPSSLPKGFARRSLSPNRHHRRSLLKSLPPKKMNGPWLKQRKSRIKNRTMPLLNPISTPRRLPNKHRMDHFRYRPKKGLPKQHWNFRISAIRQGKNQRPNPETPLHSPLPRPALRKLLRKHRRNLHPAHHLNPVRHQLRHLGPARPARPRRITSSSLNLRTSNQPRI